MTTLKRFIVPPDPLGIVLDIRINDYGGWSVWNSNMPKLWNRPSNREGSIFYTL